MLPYQGQTLIGTTEVCQKIEDKIEPSKKEISDLMQAYNKYFKHPITAQDITQSFAGLRPLIQDSTNPSKTSREYVIQANNKLINVFGGKWTTSRQLAKKVVDDVTW